MNPLQFTELQKNIFVENVPGDPVFSEMARLALEKLKSVEVGQRLFSRLAESDCPIKIKKKEINEMTVEDGELVIHWAKRQVPVLCLQTGRETQSPPFITLAHELIHAYHYIKGNLANGEENDEYWTCQEEYKTIMGFPSKKPGKLRRKITENAFREAFKIPLRFAHRIVSYVDLVAQEKLDTIRVNELIKFANKKRKRT